MPGRSGAELSPRELQLGDGASRAVAVLLPLLVTSCMTLVLSCLTNITCLFQL